MENEEARRIPNGGKKLLRHVLATTVFYVGEENRTTWFQHVCVDWLERRRCQIVSHFGDVELDAEVREYCRTRWVSITEYCVCATGPPREVLPAAQLTGLVVAPWTRKLCVQSDAPLLSFPFLDPVWVYSVPTAHSEIDWYAFTSLNSKLRSWNI